MSDDSSGDGGWKGLAGAAIGAVAVIIAAVIASKAGVLSITVSPAPAGTITVRPTVTVTDTAGARPTKRPAGLSKSTSVLAPVNQSGWALDWHNTVTIGAQGIVLTMSGPQEGNGSNYDLQYISGSSGGGWLFGSNTNALIYWVNTYRPGPASITGIINNGQDQNAGGQEAHVGDRLCYQGYDDVAYLQVTAIRADGVVADMWLWSQP